MKPLVTKLVVHSSETGKHLDWLARLMMQSVESSGVVSAEIYSVGKEWMLLQQFYTQKQIDAWLASDGRKKLMRELDSREVTVTESQDEAFANMGCVSVAIATRVKKGQEDIYFDFERKYQVAQANAPGYRGAYLQPPTKGMAGIWTTIIRFDSPKSMDQWINSEERKKIVQESEQLVSSTDIQEVTTSFPGWFSTGSAGPPNWKTALLILLGLYPSVMLVVIYLLPHMKGYPTAVNNFIGNTITVAITTWLTMPLFIKIYQSWLFPTVSTPKWVDPVSVLSLVILFALGCSSP